MKLGSFSHLSLHLQTGCPSQMSHSDPCWMHMKRSQVASLGIPTGPFFPLTSMYRAATQLFVPQTLGQHFSKVSHSWGERNNPIITRDRVKSVLDTQKAQKISRCSLWGPGLKLSVPPAMSRNVTPASPKRCLNTPGFLKCFKKTLSRRKLYFCLSNTNIIVSLS